MRWSVLSRIRPSFPGLSRSSEQVPHVLLTRWPLRHQQRAGSFSARLACVQHAASVHPEPGSNSPNKNYNVQTSNDQQDRTENPAPGNTTTPPTEVGASWQPFKNKWHQTNLAHY